MGSARPSLADPPGGSSPERDDDDDDDDDHGDGPGVKRLTFQVTDLAGNVASLQRSLRADGKDRKKENARVNIEIAALASKLDAVLHALGRGDEPQSPTSPDSFAGFQSSSGATAAIAPEDPQDGAQHRTINVAGQR